MASLRFRDDDSSFGRILGGVALGALAGLALGVVLAQKSGGIGRLRERFTRALRRDEESGDESADARDADDLTPGEELEEAVLVAFEQDDVLNERAIDIGAIGAGIVELSGWVRTDEESERATKLAQGVEGVTTVVNRLMLGDVDDLDTDDFDAEEDEEAEDPPARPGAKWEGQRVGTGRRRQGTADEPDRHVDPKPELESQWLDKDNAIRNAADDLRT